MKHMCCTILIGIFLSQQGFSQIPDLLPGNKSISIHYDLNPALKNVFVSAKASSDHDLLTGINYNYGTPMKFSVYSSSPYDISLTSFGSSYMPASSSIPMRPIDITDYIFYKVVENNTGGHYVTSNNILGYVLGKNPQTIISNCPANIIPGDNKNIPANFGLTFKVYPGYSLPPGNYTTQILITATFQ
jgi:hypothetical protein